MKFNIYNPPMHFTAVYANPFKNIYLFNKLHWSFTFLCQKRQSRVVSLQNLPTHQIIQGRSLHCYQPNGQSLCKWWRYTWPLHVKNRSFSIQKFHSDMKTTRCCYSEHGTCKWKITSCDNWRHLQIYMISYCRSAFLFFSSQRWHFFVSHRDIPVPCRLLLSFTTVFRKNLYMNVYM